MQEYSLRHRSLNTLYVFRYDFASRAKKCYLPHEVATLMDHTNKESLSCYRKEWSKKPLGGQNKLLPCPDLAFLDLATEYWKLKSLTLKPMNSHEPECESHDMRGFFLPFRSVMLRFVMLIPYGG